MKISIYIGQGGSTRHGEPGMTDMSDYCLMESFDITRSLYSQVDSLNIRLLEDPSVVFNVNQGDDIIVEDRDNPQDRLFGGVIQNVVVTSIGINQVYAVRATDWTYILNKTTIRKNYETAGQTDQEIIRSVVTGDKPQEAGLTEFSVNKVTKGRDIETLSFNGSSVKNVIDQIAEITGFIWYVDPFKNIVYRDRTLDSAYVGFSTTPAESANVYPMQNLTLTKSLGSVNQVEVQGGGGMSDDQTEIYSGDGSTKVFILGNQTGTHILMHPPKDYQTLRVYVNTGSNGSPTWTEKSVRNPLTGGITGDVEYNREDHTLEFGTAPPNFANSWRVTGRYHVDASILNEDPDAIAQHGRTYKMIVRAQLATEPSHAWELSQAILRENTDRIYVRFTTNYDIPEPGRMSFVNHPGMNLTNKPFLIRTVSTSIIGGEVAHHAVEGEIIDSKFYTRDRSDAAFAAAT
tara:strand:- start:6290 stop:7669 length:1380 start_codon:yes stop_codon:yes gene_type:complete